MAGGRKDEKWGDLNQTSGVCLSKTVSLTREYYVRSLTYIQRKAGGTEKKKNYERKKIGGGNQRPAAAKKTQQKKKTPFISESGPAAFLVLRDVRWKTRVKSCLHMKVLSPHT